MLFAALVLLDHMPRAWITLSIFNSIAVAITALFSLFPPNNHAEPRSPEAASAAADGRLASQRYGEEDEAGALARARALALFLFNRRRSILAALLFLLALSTLF